MTADSPECLKRAQGGVSSGFVEAAAVQLPHSGQRYKPTFPGRLIHCDIAGPFVPTLFGSYKYVLVLIDDHSRFKSVYFMKNKSERIKLDD